MKTQTKHLLVDQKLEQSPENQNQPPAPVEVVELTDADLEAIAGAAISFNHNETLVSAEETVNPSSAPVEVEELSDADLEAIAGAGMGTSAVIEGDGIGTSA